MASENRRLHLAVALDGMDASPAQCLPLSIYEDRQVEHPRLLAKRQREAEHRAMESVHVDEVRDFDDEPRKASWHCRVSRALMSVEERRDSLESRQKAVRMKKRFKKN